MARFRMEDGRVLDSACKRDRTPSDPPLERAVERLGKLHERLLSARRSPLGDEGFTPGFSRTLHAEAQWAEGVAALRRLLEDGRAAKSEYHKLMACVEAIEASTDDEQGARLREYEMKQVLYLGRRIRTAEAKFYRRQDGPEVAA